MKGGQLAGKSARYYSGTFMCLHCTFLPEILATLKLMDFEYTLEHKSLNSFEMSIIELLCDEISN